MTTTHKVLTRSKHGLVSGTLSGLADHFGIRKGRLQLVFLFLAFVGIGFVFYFVLWASIPSYAQRDLLLEKLENEQ